MKMGSQLTDDFSSKIYITHTHVVIQEPILPSPIWRPLRRITASNGQEVSMLLLYTMLTLASALH